MTSNRRSRGPRPTNCPSALLSNQENEIIFNAIGKGCVTLATGVVQVYLADPPARTRWNKRCCGVACFIKDNPKRSYYIRVYDIKQQSLIWEQELYNQFKYKTPREYFHTFEADNAQAGLNFASEDEAHKFKEEVESKLMERVKKRMERKKTQSGAHNTNPPPPPASQPSHVKSTNTNSNVAKQPVEINNKQSAGKKKDKKKKLTKEDIGQPSEFRHVGHVGWNPEQGFDIDKLDPTMKLMFEEVGLNEKEIDKGTLDFIYDFVDQHGGLDAVKNEMATRPPPPQPPPSHNRPPPGGVRPGAPRPPPARSNNVPPPPPSRSAQAPPPPPNRGPPQGRQMVAPPPPPGAPPPPPMRPPNERQNMAAPPPPPVAPPPPPVGNVPPPPPPPAAPPLPPPTPLANTGNMPPPHAPPDGRSALLASIHQGTNLKPVESSAGSAGHSDARGDLLSDIRAGATLKAVKAEDRPTSGQGGGIVGALAMALAKRQNQIQGSDDDDDDEDDDVDDDDDDWSD